MRLRGTTAALGNHPHASWRVHGAVSATPAGVLYAAWEIDKHNDHKRVRKDIVTATVAKYLELEVGNM
jgi:hypothetical protein